MRTSLLLWLIGGAAVANGVLGCAHKTSRSHVTSTPTPPNASTAQPRELALRPAALSREEILQGMDAVKPAVRDCYAKYRDAGVAMVTVSVGEDGRVASAQCEGRFAGKPTGTCVEQAVATAQFRPSTGMGFKYPFQLR
jgi:hypothetical protein